jgi:tetratricopeptide (TPR) repeat protein
MSNLTAQKWLDSLEVARKAYKSGDYQKATKYYKSAQNHAPEDVDLSDEIAQSTYRSRDFEGAEKAFQQSASNKKSKEEKAKLQHNTGNAQMKKKDYDGAIASYKESLRNNPNDPETKYNLSEAIRQKNEQEKKNQKDEQNQNNQNNQSQNNSNNQSSNSEQNSGSDNKKMPNKQADKMLDDLTRQEAATKRRLGRNNKGKGSVNKSGKDW